ncbi:MAG TPA: RDD family protein, partial [Smithellaceae bacterium]|nr:RDD family protein [Smithellaceae bacterium]
MTTYRFAGFWRRFVAYMIDGFIISVLFTFFMIIATVAFIAGALSNDGSRLMTNMLDPAWVGALLAPIWVFSIILNIAYFTYFHGSTGRTPGKSVMGLQVISAQGTPVSYGIAFLRSVG